MTRNRESLALAGGTLGKNGGKKVEFESNLRAYGSEEQGGGSGGAAGDDNSGCSALCTTGPRHGPITVPC